MRCAGVCMGPVLLAWLVLLALDAPAGEVPLRQVIDQKVSEAWKREKVTPTALADDATFLRRVYLDLVGTIPTFEETKRFLEDGSSDKRARVIDQLLDDPRFAIHQADVWDMVLFGRNPPGFYARKRSGFRKWMRVQFKNNVPYDQWVKELLLARGNSYDQGSPMYLVQYDRKPEDATVAITQTFLGVQLQCARCHDHPFDVWTQKDFYGMAAFFARLELVRVGKVGREQKLAIGEHDRGEILFTGPAKDQKPGQKGMPIKPRFLHGDTLKEPAAKKVKGRRPRFPSGKMPPPPRFSRKAKLAEWITSKDNPYFAKAVANRVWGQFMGRGMADPVDNLSEHNPPTHPELLKETARALVAHKFDLKWYIRELCNSKTYQRGASGPVEEARPVWFQRARVRPLSAEELIASWRVATGYDVTDSPKRRDKKDDRYAPLGSGYLLRFFGKPTDGVGNFQGGLQEHLYLNNGPIGQLITRDKGGLYDAVASSKEPWEKRVERLYLGVLNRKPRPEETKKFVAYLSTKDDSQDRLEEAIWVLLTCSEFRFNH